VSHHAGRGNGVVGHLVDGEHLGLLKTCAPVAQPVAVTKQLSITGTTDDHVAVTGPTNRYCRDPVAVTRERLTNDFARAKGLDAAGCGSPAGGRSAGGLLSVRCVAGGYVYTAGQPGTGIISATVGPRCSHGQIITGGFNVYPAEIERIVASHPAVAMVAVGSVPDETRGELARACVVLRPGATATEAEIIDHCRLHLAVYKLPRSVQFVPDLPKTSTGKVMRRQLRTLNA
jgi:AMP-binding enzyme C-terminal domain